MRGIGLLLGFLVCLAMPAPEAAGQIAKRFDAERGSVRLKSAPEEQGLEAWLYPIDADPAESPDARGGGFEATVKSLAAGRTLLRATRSGRPTIDVGSFSGEPTIALLTSETTTIRLDLDAEHLIFTDYFAEDFILSPGDAETVRLPPHNRNFLAPLGEGNELAMVSWGAAAPAIRVQSTGERFSHADVELTPGGPVFITLMATAGVWARVDPDGLSRSEDRRLDWTVPYEAFWRMTVGVDRPPFGGRIDESWWSVIRRGNRFENPRRNDLRAGTDARGENRQAWSATRQTYAYPFFIDGEDGFLRFSQFRVREMNSTWMDPILIYPLEASERTPEDAPVARELLRRNIAVLGGEDFEAVMGVEALFERDPRDVYRGTCGTTEMCHGIIEEGRAAEEFDRMRDALRSMDKFVHNTRDRVEEYRAWAEATRDWLEERSAAAGEDPALASSIAEARVLIDHVLDWYERSREQMRSPEEIAALSAEFIEMLGSDLSREEMLEVSDRLGRQMRSVGSIQDRTVARYRMVVKNMRQKALRDHLVTPSEAARAFNAELVDRTHQVLRVAFRW